MTSGGAAEDFQSPSAFPGLFLGAVCARAHTIATNVLVDHQWTAGAQCTAHRHGLDGSATSWSM
jgi:hypothetical protein